MPKEFTGEIVPYALPGGYPVFVVTLDGGTLCVKCAQEARDRGLTGDPEDAQWFLIGAEVNYEDGELYCDDCYERIPSAYAEED